jgi:hypothetical protein
MEGLSVCGKGFLFPKNALGLVARDKDLAFGVDLGLEVVLAPVGRNEFAAGFGLNSFALTLNLADAADVGVRALLDGWELVIGGATEGLPPFLSPCCIGKGCGMLTANPF